MVTIITRDYLIGKNITKCSDSGSLQLTLVASPLRQADGHNKDEHQAQEYSCSHQPHHHQTLHVLHERQCFCWLSVQHIEFLQFRWQVFPVNILCCLRKNARILHLCISKEDLWDFIRRLGKEMTHDHLRYLNADIKILKPVLEMKLYE